VVIAYVANQRLADGGTRQIERHTDRFARSMGTFVSIARCGRWPTRWPRSRALLKLPPREGPTGGVSPSRLFLEDTRVIFCPRVALEQAGEQRGAALRRINSRHPGDRVMAGGQARSPSTWTGESHIRALKELLAARFFRRERCLRSSTATRSARSIATASSATNLIVVSPSRQHAVAVAPDGEMVALPMWYAGEQAKCQDLSMDIDKISVTVR